MKKPLVGAFLALALLGAGAAPAIAVTPADAAPAATIAAPHGPEPTVKAVDFAGTVALSNCSGSVVRMPASEPDDPALVLSNGHCIESGFPAAGEVIVDQPSSRSFSLLNSAGSRVATLRASKIAYATMTDTDISLYQLTTHLRADPEQLRHQGARTQRRAPGAGHGHQGRLRVLEADLQLQHRRLRVPPQGG